MMRINRFNKEISLQAIIINSLKKPSHKPTDKEIPKQQLLHDKNSSKKAVQKT